MSSRILTNIENIFSITLPFQTSYRQFLLPLTSNASSIYDVTFRRLEFITRIWSTASFHLRSSRAPVRKRTCASLSSRSEALRVRWSRGLGAHVDLRDVEKAKERWRAEKTGARSGKQYQRVNIRGKGWLPLSWRITSHMFKADLP